MDINSTQEEKFEEIKNKQLTIVKWNETKKKDITITNTEMTISKKS